MKKITIIVVLASLILTACAGGANQQADPNGTSETINTAPTRPYSNLMFPIPVEKLAERADHVLMAMAMATFVQMTTTVMVLVTPLTTAR